MRRSSLKLIAMLSISIKVMVRKIVNAAAPVLLCCFEKNQVQVPSLKS